MVKIRYSSGFGASIAWFLFNPVDLGTSSTGTRGFVGRRQDFLQANGQTSIALARLLRTRGLLRSSVNLYPLVARDQKAFPELALRTTAATTAEPNIEAKSVAESNTETKPKVEPDTDTNTKSNANANTETEPDSKPDTDCQPDTDTNSKPDADSQPITDSQSDDPICANCRAGGQCR